MIFYYNETSPSYKTKSIKNYQRFINQRKQLIADITIFENNNLQCMESFFICTIFRMFNKAGKNLKNQLQECRTFLGLLYWNRVSCKKMKVNEFIHDCSHIPFAHISKFFISMHRQLSFFVVVTRNLRIVMKWQHN